MVFQRTSNSIGNFPVFQFLPYYDAFTNSLHLRKIFNFLMSHIIYYMTHIFNEYVESKTEKSFEISSKTKVFRKVL